MPEHTPGCVTTEHDYFTCDGCGRLVHDNQIVSDNDGEGVYCCSLCCEEHALYLHDQSQASREDDMLRQEREEESCP